MHRARLRGVHPCYQLRTRMRERHSATRKRDADLPGMEVAGKDQAEGAFGETFDDSGEVTEENPELCTEAGKVESMRLTAFERLRIYADDRDADPAKRDDGSIVTEEGCLVEIA